MIQELPSLKFHCDVCQHVSAEVCNHDCWCCCSSPEEQLGDSYLERLPGVD